MKNSSHVSGRMKLVAVFAVLLGAVGVHAEPYIAVRTGFKCSQCHLNKIGGAGRTEYGQAYTQYQLLMKQSQDALIGDNQGALTSFNPKLNEAITVGANFRMEETANINQSQGTGSKPANQLGIAESNIYMNIELVKNFVSMYTDMGFGNSSGSREMWMMVRNLPGNSYVRVGQTLLPYGLRLMDDQAFIRQMTQYTYNNPAIAAEVGFEPGPFSVIANMTNNRLSSVGYVTYRHFRVGGSYSQSTKKSPQSFPDAYGPFAGLNFGKFTVLSEVDFLKLPSGDTTINQVAQFYEVNFLPTQGLNLKTTYEYFDRNTSVANRRDGQDRWTFGVEYFPIQFMQVGLYYRINEFVPQNDVENQDYLIGRAHVFF